MKGQVMNSKERIGRMLAHKESDRVPVWDEPWPTTLGRWYKEGIPSNTSYVEYFDLDYIGRIRVDNSPRYPEKVLEDTPEYTVYTTQWGLTLKSFKNATSTPAYVDFTITDMERWQEAKKLMTPSKDRIDWDYLRRNYPVWRQRGYWIEALLWFGFDVTHSWAVGTEQLLMAMITDPSWCVDMFNHFLDVNLALLEQVWQAGYTFDSVFWYDDMGYKKNQFFSLQTYRQLLKPVHQRAIDWAHAKGIKAHLHSCGDINPFVPELIEMGLDVLNPLEVKAGMDPLELKKKYGNKLVLHGGINAVNWDNPDLLREEIESKVPLLKESGGYIFSSDHSIPDSVSLATFRDIIEMVKKVGSYD
jgi:uroporphyrinogen decarboxylase